MALPALVVVVGFACTVLSAVATQAACLDAARAGARAAARGDDDTAVDAAVRQVAARAGVIEVRRTGGLVSVTVSARPAVVGTRVPVPAVSAQAVAADEAVP